MLLWYGLESEVFVGIYFFGRVINDIFVIIRFRLGLFWDGVVGVGGVDCDVDGVCDWDGELFGGLELGVGCGDYIVCVVWVGGWFDVVDCGVLFCVDNI